jgi:hypothetical protein
MSPKRGDRVAPPPRPEDWDVRFADTDSAKSWEELCRQAANNTFNAWQEMRTGPAPHPMRSRHHQLRGLLANRLVAGRSLPQWQIEVTAGGRIWYAIDVERREVRITYASPRHPKATD